MDELNESQMHAKIKSEVVKLLHLLPKDQFSVANFLQGMFEDISNELLSKGDKYLSFQFYILSGRFSIQYIMDTYFEHFIE